VTTATAARVAGPRPRLADLATALGRESGLFVLGIVVIALHVLDDSFLQPSPGTSAGDHLVSVPLVVLALAAWADPRLRGGRRGAMALLFGVLGIVAGAEAVHYTAKVGASGDHDTGLLAVPAGLLLLGLGAITLWRTRRTVCNRPWRYCTLCCSAPQASRLPCSSSRP
jgi:uncharacterized protein